MVPRLTPIQRCVEVAGLKPNEIMLGVNLSEKHERMLAKYRRARRSDAVARAKIVTDLRDAVSRGATGEAADLLIVLRRLLASDPAGLADRRGVWTARRPCARPRDRPSWSGPSGIIALTGGGACEVVTLRALEARCGSAATPADCF
ncbi:MAG TPA: hypothetical protein VIF34_15955 [Methylocystis sp.]|jgi:hypothetical protein